MFLILSVNIARKVVTVQTNRRCPVFSHAQPRALLAKSRIHFTNLCLIRAGFSTARFWWKSAPASTVALTPAQIRPVEFVIAITSNLRSCLTRTCSPVVSADCKSFADNIGGRLIDQTDYSASNNALSQTIKGVYLCVHTVPILTRLPLSLATGSSFIKSPSSDHSFSPLICLHRSLKTKQQRKL